MTPTDALRSGFALLGTRTRDTLTLYLLAAGAVFAARVPLLVALGAAVAVLAAQGRIAPVVEQLDELGSQLDGSGFGEAPPAPGTTPELPPAVGEAVAGLVTPTTAVLFGLGVLLTLLALVVAQAVGTAVTLGGIAGALRDDDPVAAGLSHLSRTSSYIGVWFVRLALLTLVTVVAVAVGAAGASLGPAGALLGLLAVLVWVVVVILVVLLLAFAGQAIAVDGVGVAGALKASVAYPVREPFGFVVYLVLAVVGYGGGVVFSLLASALGVPRAAALVLLLVVPPVLDGFKTALYAETDLPAVGGASSIRADGGREGEDESTAAPDDETSTSTEDTPATTTDDGFVWGAAAESADADESGAVDDRPLPDADEFDDPSPGPGLGSRFVAGVRRGLARLGEFVVGHPLANLAGILLLVGGIVAGWRLTADVGTRLDGPTDVATVFGETPLAATAVFVDIAANNWLVAATASFGGLGFGVPTVVNLLFNGVLIGALAGVFDLTTFLALVVPHGVIEIPALAVAGGLGLHLGRVGYRGLRGRDSPTEVADELRRAFDVLVGLAVVLIVTAAIEAYLTPLIASFILQ